MNTWKLTLLIFIGLMIGFPLLIIWSLNTLFPVLAIPVTLKTWFATFVIWGLIASSNTSKNVFK